MDISKAFDSVSYRFLFAKILTLWLAYNVLLGIKAIMCRRSFIVHLGAALPSSVGVPNDVFHGSVLGSMLLNDLPGFLKSMYDVCG